MDFDSDLHEMFEIRQNLEMEAIPNIRDQTLNSINAIPAIPTLNSINAIPSNNETIIGEPSFFLPVDMDPKTVFCEPAIFHDTNPNPVQLSPVTEYFGSDSDQFNQGDLGFPELQEQPVFTDLNNAAPYNPNYGDQENVSTANQMTWADSIEFLAENFHDNTLPADITPCIPIKQEMPVLKYEPMSPLNNALYSDDSQNQNYNINQPKTETVNDWNGYQSSTYQAGYSNYGSPSSGAVPSPSLTPSLSEASQQGWTDTEVDISSTSSRSSFADDTAYSHDQYRECAWLKTIKVGKNNRPRGPKCYEFLLRLLEDPFANPSMVKWEEKSAGSFKLLEKDKISAIWGRRPSKKKNEKTIKYESFARILRYHYKKGKGMVLPVSEKHLVYKFSPKIMDAIKRGQIP